MKKILFVLITLLSYSSFSTSSGSSEIYKNNTNAIEELYHNCLLDSVISFQGFENAMVGYVKYSPTKPILAICDFTKPSSEERFIVIDLENKKIISKSLVAHGKNSGGLMATHFSNTFESLQSSLGFFRIGASIMVPKHGLSLLLDGLESGINDNARNRGIIIHGAEYVSKDFVKKYGYLGKSFGCPALPNELIKNIVPILQNGALLYIYAN